MHYPILEIAVLQNTQSLTFALDDKIMITIEKIKIEIDNYGFYNRHVGKFKVHTNYIVFISEKFSFRIASSEGDIKTEEKMIELYRHPSGKRIILCASWEAQDDHVVIKEVPIRYSLTFQQPII